jgi:hypothetical protein
MGKYLARELSAIYGKEAAVIVIFASADTPNETGPARAAGRVGLTVRKGGSTYSRPDSKTRRFRASVGHGHSRSASAAPQQFADMIVGKLGVLVIAVSAPSADARDPPGTAGTGPYR